MKYSNKILFSFFPFFISTKQNDKGHRVNTILQSKHSWRFHKQLSFLSFPHFQISSVFLFRFPQFLICISLGSGLAVHISTLWTFVSFSAHEKDSFGIFGSISKPEKSFTSLNSLFMDMHAVPSLVGGSKEYLNLGVILFKGVQREGPSPNLRFGHVVYLADLVISRPPCRNVSHFQLSFFHCWASI